MAPTFVYLNCTPPPPYSQTRTAAYSSLADKYLYQGRQAAELSSNNPFRRAVSPTTDSTAQLAGASLAPPENKDASLKRVSTNPFLDSYDPELVQVPRQPSPQRPPTDHRNPHYAPRPRRPSNRDDVANMMVRLKEKVSYLY